MKLKNPSIRSLQRAKNNPEKTNSVTLYALAEKEKTSMEEILGQPLYIAGVRVDGYFLDDYYGVVCFSTEEPDKYKKHDLFVWCDMLYDKWHMNKYKDIRGARTLYPVTAILQVDIDKFREKFGNPDNPNQEIFYCWSW